MIKYRPIKSNFQRIILPDLMSNLVHFFPWKSGWHVAPDGFQRQPPEPLLPCLTRYLCKMGNWLPDWTETAAGIVSIPPFLLTLLPASSFSFSGFDSLLLSAKAACLGRQPGEHPLPSTKNRCYQGSARHPVLTDRTERKNHMLFTSKCTEQMLAKYWYYFICTADKTNRS